MNCAILCIMIARLRGKITFQAEKFVVIDVGGVGYRVFVTPDTLQRAGKPARIQRDRAVLAGTGVVQSGGHTEEEVQFWTHLHVREDSQDLYGFLQYAEMEFFERLIHVSGVGPRSAMNVLAVAPLDVLRRAIAAGDVSYLTRVSGIGRRTAEKIIIELSDALGKGLEEKGSAAFRESEDVFDALQSLGYSAKEARDALGGVPTEVEGREARLKAALQLLSGGRTPQ